MELSSSLPWVALLLLAACGAPAPDPVPPLHSTSPAPVRTVADDGGSAGAIERREVDGEPCEVVTASADAASYDEARNRAIATARSALLAFQRQRVRQELRDLMREETEIRDNERRTRYREEVESVLVARTEGDLQRSRVLDATATATATGFRGRATVACPERVLFPTRRLQALVLRSGVVADDFLRLATVYESEQQLVLAEQALRWAYDRGGGAQAALELAKHYGRRALDAEALRWCDVAAAEGAGTELARDAQARSAELRRRVEPADRLVAQLLRVAEAKQDRSRFQAFVFERRPGRADVEWDLRWTLRGDLDRRVLKMWLDDSLTPAWWADDESDEPRASDRDGGLRFARPKDSPPARVLFWSLPLDSDLWPRLVAWKNVEIALAEADETQRLQLRDLVAALRNSAAVAAVIPIE